MQAVLVGVMRLVSASLAASCLQSPPAWSPDGQWLAYTTAQGQAAPLRPGWLIPGADAPNPAAPGREAGQPLVAGRKYRIWAMEKATGASVLIEDSLDPLTAPVWGPDGHSLCYGRLVVPTAARSGDRQRSRAANLEIVVQDALDRKRVVATVPGLDPDALTPSLVASIAFAWGPDGQHLAVPLPGPSPSVAILVPETGRIVRSIERAERPAWSPDGSRLAFLVPSEDRSNAMTLQVIGRDLVAASPILDVVEPRGTLAWSPDGQSIILPGRDMRGPGILQVTLATKSSRSLLAMGQVIPGPLSSSLDRQQEQVVITANTGAQVAAIIFGELRGGKIFKRFHPVDLGHALGAVALHPDGRVAALRVQVGEDVALPLLCDLVTDEVTLLAPDEQARASWMGSLVSTAESVLRVALPSRAGDRQAPGSRPTLLPVPGEITEQDSAHFRLRHLAKLGRALLDQPQALRSDAPADGSPVEPADELRLFFDYLRGDFAAAQADLESIEARIKSPTSRIPLLALRAQILLARGEPARAKPVVEYLKLAAGRVRRVEDTPAGPVTTDLPEPGGESWARFLAERVDAKPTKDSGPQAEDEDAADLRTPNVQDEMRARMMDAPGLLPPGRARGFVDPPIPGFDPRDALPPVPRPARVPAPGGMMRFPRPGAVE